MTDQMVPHYREEKAIAIAAMFLNLSGGVCDKYWLNKVMYYVERQSLVKSGQPLYFDKLYSIPWGPVVSIVKDGIDSAKPDSGSPWSAYFILKNNKIYLKADPSYSCLSEFDEDLIREVFAQFKGWDFNRLQAYFHNLPEYKETNSRVDINYEDILEAEGFNKEDIQETLQEISYLSFLETSLHCVP